LAEGGLVGGQWVGGVESRSARGTPPVKKNAIGGRVEKKKGGRGNGALVGSKQAGMESHEGRRAEEELKFPEGKGIRASSL